MLRPVRAVPLLSLLLVGCMGPPAPDAELCRDVIDRLCATPVCPSAQVRFNLPEMDCAATVQQRTGCFDIDFAFTTPSRARVLECRLPLVRESSARLAHPSCEDIDETIRICPDLVRFLGGTP